jgi:hypothetical protein
MRIKPVSLAISYVLLVATVLPVGVSQIPEDFQKGVYALLKGGDLGLEMLPESHTSHTNISGLRIFSISPSALALGERGKKRPLPEFAGDIAVAFTSASGERSKETELKGRDFTMSLSTPAGASAEIDFSGDEHFHLGVTCRTSSRSCEAFFNSRGASSLRLAFDWHHPPSMKIEYVDLNRHARSMTLTGISFIKVEITVDENVGPFRRELAPIYYFAGDAFSARGNKEISLSSVFHLGPPTPILPQEIIVKNKHLDLTNTMLERFQVVAQEQQGVGAFLGFQKQESNVSFVATSSAPALVAINGEQVMEGEIENSLVNPIRLAQQDIAEGSPEIEFSIYEKSRSADLQNVVISSGGKLAGVIKFHDPSLYPAMCDFLREHGKLFEQLRDKYAAADAAQLKKEGSLIDRNVVEARTQAMLAAYILDYLKEEKRIDGHTYEKLSRVQNKSLFFLPGAIAASEDHKAFIEFATEARGRDFLNYLKHTNPNEIKLPPASASLDKAWGEIFRELKNWLPARLDRGRSELRVASLKYNDEEDIVVGLHFPKDIEAKEYDAEIVVTGTKVPEKHIPLVIQVYDSRDWLKSSLIYLLGAITVAVIGYIGWRVQQSVARKLANSGVLEVEFRSGKYAVVNQKDSNPFVELQAVLRIHNRRDTPTSVYCDDLKVQLGEASEDFPAPELQPLGGKPTDLGRQLQVVASSSCEINFCCRKAYPEDMNQLYLSGQKLMLSAVVRETYGASTQVTGQLEPDTIAVEK